MPAGASPDSRLLARIERAGLPPAVVAGTDVTGLAIARALKRHGVLVIGLDDRYHRFTSYSGAWHYLSCPETDGPGFVSYLQQLADRLPRRAALFLSMDQHVASVARSGDHGLRERYFFEFPEAGAVDILLDKDRFADVARQRGWPIPRTVVCNTLQDVEAAARTLTFPVILKPAAKHAAFRRHSPSKAFRCETAEELSANYRC